MKCSICHKMVFHGWLVNINDIANAACDGCIDDLCALKWIEEVSAKIEEMGI